MELNDIFATLAEPNRRAIVEILRKKPRRAGELAHLFAMSPPAMSRHLRVLRESGMIEDLPDPEDARARIYQLRPEPFDKLSDWLEEIAAFWTEQLGAFKAHAEKSSRQLSAVSRQKKKK